MSIEFVSNEDLYREVLRRETCLTSIDVMAMYDRALRRGVYPAEAFERLRAFVFTPYDRFHEVISRRRPMWAPFAWRNAWHRPHAGGWS